MNPVYQELIKSILRKLLTAVATYLLAAGLIDEHLAQGLVSETTALVLGLILAGWSIAWTWVRENGLAYFKRNLAEAGADPKVTKPEQVVAKAVELQKAGSKPNPIVVNSGPAGPTAVVALLLAVGLASNVACAGSNPAQVTPDQRVGQVTEWATDSTRLVSIAQRTVNTYARGSGGRTAVTDRITTSIEKEFVPVARRLETVLRTYAAATSLDVKEATKTQIRDALESYEEVAKSVFGDTEIPAGLTAALADTTFEIQTLIKNVRGLVVTTP